MDFSLNVGGIGEGSDPFMKASHKGKGESLENMGQERKAPFLLRRSTEKSLPFL